MLCPSFIRTQTIRTTLLSPRAPGTVRIVALITAAAVVLGPPGTAVSPRVVYPVAAVRLPGHVLPALDGATPRSPSATTDALLLTVVLRRTDEAGFQDHLRDVYDPASPRYRRFLTPAQLTERFGPSREAYDALLAFLGARGFARVAGSENRLTVSVRGTRAAAEGAFAVRIGDYEVAGRRFYANDRDPALPPELAPHVLAIAGLSDLAQPSPATLSQAATICAIAAALVGLVWWPAAAVAALCAAVPILDPFGDGRWPYNRPPLRIPRLFSAGATAAVPAAATSPGGVRLATGAGQTVGITSFSAFALADVRDWLALVGAPPEQASRLRRVTLGGGAPLGPDQVEPLLDVAAVMSVARDADVVVYDSPFRGPGVSFQALFNAMIDDGVDVISNSWAYCENQTTRADVESIDAILQTAAAAGISVFSASGDAGSTCLNGSPNTAHVPASVPHVTAVGGTTLTLGPGFSYGGETWWDGAAAVPPTGQGGFGVSRFFSRPAYQDGRTAAGMRSLPDVAANADPAAGFVLCQASSGGCPDGKLHGGTSVAAPLWAGFAALLNEARGENLGFLNPVIYPLAGTAAFHDAASMGSEFARVGLGSPNLDVLHRLLNGIGVGAPDPARSEVVHAGSLAGGAPGFPLQSVPADGNTAGVIVVTVVDAAGHTVAGARVTLAGDNPTAVIAPPGPVTADGNGQAVFRVNSLVPGTVTVTATAGGVVLAQKPVVTFGVPPAASGGIGAGPAMVAADGTSTATITVELRDALGRPTPGKLVTLSQGAGRSVVRGPIPSVTDAGGQIVFIATNLVNETVTYTAVDVTDGDLPVPGSAQVVFANGPGTGCATTPPTGQNGYVVTPFATGFVTGSLFYSSINFGACNGASPPAFLDGSAFLANGLNGDLFRLDAGGGVASSGDRLATHGPTLLWQAIGADGRLYATRTATGTLNSGVVVELDPDTGAILRTLASDLRCPFSLATDPLSGDLFFVGGCSGSSADPNLYRVRNPAGAMPAVEVYATLSTTPNGYLAFAPDGTLYVVTGYFDPMPAVARVSGTNGPQPPTVTPLPGLTSFFWVNVAESDAGGAARSLILLTADGLELVDLTTTPPTRTLLAKDIGGGTFGPDGCLYSSLGYAVFRLTDATGGCSFATRSTSPALSLSPDAVSPDPAQGSPQAFTASFRNLAVPAGTPVFFKVSGANPGVRLVRTDAAGRAVFSYTAARSGRDVVLARAAVTGSVLSSNRATVTWTAGRHTTFLTLNPGPRAGEPGRPADVRAALSNVSVDPPAPVVGAAVDFTLWGTRCSGTTDALGIAACRLPPAGPGAGTLAARFAGSAQLLPADAAVGFTVVAPGPVTTTTLPSRCDGVACDDGDSCTADTCVEGTCQHTPPPGLEGVTCYLGALRRALESAPRDELRRGPRKKLLGTVRQATRLVAAAQRPGRRGEKARRRLVRKLDALTRQLARLRGKRIPSPLGDTLLALALGARSSLP